MSTVKKNFESIYQLLLDNQNKKVSAILPQLVELMEPKVAAKTHKVDEEGNVTHVFCYYHKEWEAVSEVPYGKKASTTTGLNTMCKEGVSNWTKQQRELKVTKEDILTKVASGEIQPQDLPELLTQAEEHAKRIIPLGTKEETKEEVSES